MSKEIVEIRTVTTTPDQPKPEAQPATPQPKPEPKPEPKPDADLRNEPGVKREQMFVPGDLDYIAPVE